MIFDIINNLWFFACGLIAASLLHEYEPEKKFGYLIFLLTPLFPLFWAYDAARFYVARNYGKWKLYQWFEFHSGIAKRKINKIPEANLKIVRGMFSRWSDKRLYKKEIIAMVDKRIKELDL